MGDFIIEMQGICKSYGATIALDNASLHIAQGEIHALLGENGAGKTTLMKILYGLTKKDAGTILFKGNEINIVNSLDAIKLGIGMVHQHFMLADVFTVLESVVTGAEPSSKLLIDKKLYEESVQEINDRLNFKLDIHKKIEDLSVGQKQRVEIIKALYRGVEILILDEPTAVLTPQEVEDFFSMLRILQSEGKSIILITHKLNEIIGVADVVTVMRDGHFIETLPTAGASEQQLAKLMVGRDVELGRSFAPRPGTEPFFEIKSLSYKNAIGSSLYDVNLTICKGEILGIAGVDGNGQTELIEAITGISRPDSMAVSVAGADVRGNAADFIGAHIGHIPEDRNTRGLIKEMSIQDNLILGYHKRAAFQKRGVFKQKAISDYAKRLISKFSIKAAGEKVPAQSLSGGNAQKVVIGRVLSQDPQVVIAAQPTRGVDIAATEYIHNQMIAMRDNGKSVLLISADLNEIRKLSDRIAVMFKGRIVDARKADDYTEEELGMLMLLGKLTGEGV